MNEIIQKLTSREEKRIALEELRVNNLAKLEGLENTKRQLQDEIKRFRMQLVGDEPSVVTEVDKEVGKLRLKLQRVTSKQEHLSDLMICAQTGIARFNEQFDLLQIETEEQGLPEDASLADTLKRVSQKSKIVYQMIERNKHFNELCKSKAPLVTENELINGFAQSMKGGYGK